MDEPTQGIDVGAKYEIYTIMADLVKQGKAIIMVSSEMPELIGMSHRVLVLCAGRLTGALKKEEATQEAIMRFIITKGIDLSIGYVVCLTASVAASFAQVPTYESALYYGHSFPLLIPIVAGILAGGLCGLFNGVLVAYGRLPPFIATLGTMSIARGIQLIYTKAAIVGSLTTGFKALTQNSIGPAFFSFPFLGVYVVVISFIIWILLKHTKQGTISTPSAATPRPPGFRGSMWSGI
jgi:hypothetical protein